MRQIQKTFYVTSDNLEFGSLECAKEHEANIYRGLCRDLSRYLQREDRKFAPGIIEENIGLMRKIIESYDSWNK